MLLFFTGLFLKGSFLFLLSSRSICVEPSKGMASFLISARIRHCMIDDSANWIARFRASHFYPMLFINHPILSMDEG